MVLTHCFNIYLELELSCRWLMSFDRFRGMSGASAVSYAELNRISSLYGSNAAFIMNFGLCNARLGLQIVMENNRLYELRINFPAQSPCTLDMLLKTYTESCGVCKFSILRQAQFFLLSSGFLRRKVP